jgi:hypothetical protein
VLVMPEDPRSFDDDAPDTNAAVSYAQKRKVDGAAIEEAYPAGQDPPEPMDDQERHNEYSLNRQPASKLVEVTSP